MQTVKMPRSELAATEAIRRRILAGGEKLWRLEDFREYPFSATAQALSRLSRKGLLRRLSKGIYYRGRQTAFGQSRPNPTAIQELAANKPIFPSGIAAASLLGFTTQSSGRGEIATSASSLPRKLIGDAPTLHTRRPTAWAGLSQQEAAILDFLRQGGRASELSPEETIRQLLSLISNKGLFARLLKVADTEPPRVRAILGAIGEELGLNPTKLKQLRLSLNPYSRFDFGLLATLRHAKKWQAKLPRPR